MTTLVANSGRSGGGKNVRKNQTSNASHSVGDHISQKDNNEKFQPTAEQMRIASLMTDKKDVDSELKPKIDKIVELTGATSEDAAIALYDCDNDVAKAIDMILDGETLDSEWQSTGKKKKQKNPTSISSGASSEQTTSTNLNGQKNGEERKFDKNRRERTNGFEESNSAEYKTAENGRPQRGKRDPNFKPRGDRRGGGFTGGNSGYSRGQDSEEGTDDREDRFNGDSSVSRRGGFGLRGRGGGISGRGRGAPRGRGGGRGGARGYGGRGPQGSDKPSDEFLGSIDTWTNEPKPEESVNTMKVGNWSDFKGDEWVDNWTEPVDNKVFNISSDKNGPAPIPETQKTVPNAPTQMSFLSAASKSIEKESQPPQPQVQQQQQPQPPSAQSSNYAAISSGPTKRPEPTPQPQSTQHTSQPQQQQSQSQQQQPTQVNAGRALLNQIQQPQQQQASSNLKQQESGTGLGMNIYKKNATESIKSLIGVSANPIGEPLPGEISKQMSSNPRLNLNAQNPRSKIPENAVEMPTSDISGVTLRFGSLDFGSSGTSAQPNFSNISAAQENIFEAPPQKPEKNLTSLMEQNQQNANTGFRTTAPAGQKNVLTGLNDVLNADKINVGTNSYPKKNDYNMMNAYGKNTYSSDYNSGAPGYNQSHQHQQHAPQNYYAQTQFNSGNLMASSGNFNSSTYGNSGVNPVVVAQQGMKDSGVSQQSLASGSATATSSAPNSLGLMSNSTNTTNVLKTALSATGKGVHNNNNSNNNNTNMPPGVQNYAAVSMQPQNFVTNNGVHVPCVFPPFDGQYRDVYGYGSDMKFNRGTEADMNSASSQSGVGVQSMVGHNQALFAGYPPSHMPYLFSYTGQYLNPAPFAPAFPLPQTTGSTSGFAVKNSPSQSYNTHSYNSGYDTMVAGSVGGVNSGTGNVAGQSQDYSMKQSYSSQPMGHSKAMQSSTTGNDLSGNQAPTNGQSMYNKTHSQMNKQNFDKQNTYQQSSQFIGGNGINYNPNYLLPQQQIHLGGDQAGGPQAGGAGGLQRSLKGNVSGPQNSSGSFNKIWNC